MRGSALGFEKRDRAVDQACLIALFNSTMPIATNDSSLEKARRKPNLSLLISSVVHDYRYSEERCLNGMN
jgi:hypothetical protein